MYSKEIYRRWRKKKEIAWIQYFNPSSKRLIKSPPPPKISVFLPDAQEECRLQESFNYDFLELKRVVWIMYCLTKSVRVVDVDGWILIIIIIGNFSRLCSTLVRFNYHLVKSEDTGRMPNPFLLPQVVQYCPHVLYKYLSSEL